MESLFGMGAHGLYIQKANESTATQMRDILFKYQDGLTSQDRDVNIDVSLSQSNFDVQDIF